MLQINKMAQVIKNQNRALRAGEEALQTYKQIINSSNLQSHFENAGLVSFQLDESKISMVDDKLLENSINDLKENQIQYDHQINETLEKIDEQYAAATSNCLIIDDYGAAPPQGPKHSVVLGNGSFVRGSKNRYQTALTWELRRLGIIATTSEKDLAEIVQKDEAKDADIQNKFANEEIKIYQRPKTKPRPFMESILGVSHRKGSLSKQ